MRCQEFLGRLSAMIVLWWIAVIPCAAQPDITLSGVVQSGDGAPLSNVLVQAVRNGVPVPDTTGEDGSYRLPLRRGGVFSVVYYRTDLDLVVIENLVGTESQVISKVMYRTGQTRSSSAAAEALGSYSRWLLLSSRTDGVVTMSQDERRARSIRLERMWVPYNSLDSNAMERAFADHLETEKELVVAALAGEIGGQ